MRFLVDTEPDLGHLFLKYPQEKKKKNVALIKKLQIES